jgi:sugar phosphate isomerase/epimerase
MFKYSYNSLVYYGEDVATSIKRVGKYNYDGIELVGEPDDYDSTEVKMLCKDNGIVVSSICSIYNEKRDLVAPDPVKRQNAINYVKKVADFSLEVGAPVMIVVPSACMKIKGWGDPEEEWKWAVESIREGGEYANSIGVKLCIEAWNRYETYFVNRIEQCLKLMKAIDLPNVGVMGDTFHMNIDEVSIPEALLLAGKDLIHVHIADSNRAAPGKGHTDLIPVLKALKEIKYEGYITFELLPAAADPFGTMKKGGGREFFDEYTKHAIEYMKALENKM